MAEYPNRIRELRIAKGWSQETLAEHANCSKMQISGLERGRPKLDVDWMRRLAAVLDVTPAELLNASDNPFNLEEAERDLILRYRNADDGRKLEISRVAEVLIPYKFQPREAG
jgi:transcriptional regulator with XRE-family HTH domain